MSISKLFQKTLQIAQLTEGELSAIEATIKDPSVELDSAILEKLTKANQVLTSKEFLKNDPEFRESIKTEKLGKTLHEMDQRNRESWKENFDFLTEEELKSIYEDPEIKYSSTKEKKVKQLLTQKLKATRTDLETQLEELKKNSGKDNNETIQAQSNRIKELETALESKAAEFETEKAGILNQFRLKEVRGTVRERLSAKKQAHWTSLYHDTLEKNLFAHLTESFEVRADDKGELGLFQKDSPEHRAVDTETSTVLEFNTVMEKYLNDYGAIARNSGGNQTTSPATQPGTPNPTKPAEGIAEGSNAYFRQQQFARLQQKA